MTADPLAGAVKIEKQDSVSQTVRVGRVEVTGCGCVSAMDALVLPDIIVASLTGETDRLMVEVVVVFRSSVTETTKESDPKS